MPSEGVPLLSRAELSKLAWTFWAENGRAAGCCRITEFRGVSFRKTPFLI
jgi:hypothetical protein